MWIGTKNRLSDMRAVRFLYSHPISSYTSRPFGRFAVVSFKCSFQLSLLSRITPKCFIVTDKTLTFTIEARHLKLSHPLFLLFLKLIEDTFEGFTERPFFVKLVPLVQPNH